MSEQNQGEKVIEILESMYPDADCTLNYRQPWKLLIAAILAAQCTDARVNIVCEKLFKNCPTIEDISNLDIVTLEEYIRSCGFYHVKAKSIKESTRLIIDKFEGVVPQDMTNLLSLPGVGRKIANLIIGDCYNKQAIVVDTHCKRISKHIGFTDNTNPDKVEKDLMKCIPKDKWTSYGHMIVAHGRAICSSQKPKCNICKLNSICKKGIESFG